jgi:hypothetical protein
MSRLSFTGSCHCAAVRFDVRTAIVPATRCNCSLSVVEEA